MENEWFQKVPILRILLCRQCKYGVRPREVKQHLKKRHQLNHTVASQVAKAVTQWDDVTQDSNDIEIPHALDEPLPLLPCEPSGLLCRRDPQCHFIASTMASIRKHWRISH